MTTSDTFMACQGRKKEADSYLRDQNELAHNQSAWYQVNIHQAAQNAAVLEENVVRLICTRIPYSADQPTSHRLRQEQSCQPRLNLKREREQKLRLMKLNTRKCCSKPP